MRDRTRLELLSKSDRARTWIVVSIGVAAVGIMAYINALTTDGAQSTAMVSILMICIGSLVAVLQIFRYARLNEMMMDDSEPPAPRFENTVELPAVHLESRHSDNQLLRSRFKFSHSDWRVLVRELRIIKPRWNRKALENTGLFPKITAPGEFNRVNAEFERLGVIKGRPRHWTVTQQGWIDLHDAANMQVIT